jgi:hypothetical protein
MKTKSVFMGLAMGFGIWVCVGALINSLIFVVAFGLLSISSAVINAGINEYK